MFFNFLSLLVCKASLTGSNYLLHVVSFVIYNYNKMKERSEEEEVELVMIFWELN